MKTKLFLFVALFGVFFLMQSCDKDEDIVFPEYPQEKLQFNQAIFLELSGLDNRNYLDSTDLTVAAGKVVKIESVGYSIVFSGYDSPQRNSSVNLFINDMALSSLPAWLPSGQYKVKLVLHDSPANDGHIHKGYLTGIEYNILPLQ